MNLLQPNWTKKLTLSFAIVCCFLLSIFLHQFAVSNLTMSIVYANTSGLSYTLMDGNTAYQVSRGTSTDTDVVVPSVYNGKPVRGIATNGFAHSNIRTITLPNSITTIGTQAFYRSYLNTINIPSYVTTIGSSAFQESQITSINLPNSLRTIGDSAFAYSKITSVVIPPNLTSIGNYVFYNSRQLSSVTLTNGITFLGHGMFQECTSLSTISFPKSLTSIANNAFATTGLHTIQFGSDLRTIGNSSFSNHKVVNLVIPNTITQIGNSAFSNSSSLQTLVIGTGIKSLEQSVFAGSTNLTSVIIPESVTAIKESAFQGCSSLQSITIPQSVSLLSPTAFYQNPSLTAIDVHPDNQVYQTVNGVVYNKEGTLLVKYPNGKTNLDLIGSLETIGDYAFYYHTGFQSISLPEGITTIGNYAFSSSSLKEFLFSSTVTSVGYNAFSSSQIESILIPANVQTIGSMIFINAHKLHTVTIEEGGVTVIPTGAFSHTSALQNVTLSNDITELKDSAFYNSNISSLTLPTSLTRIGSYVFSNSKLQTIFIPALVDTLSIAAFESASLLSEINVDTNNATFSSIQGVLYNKNATTLMYSPENKLIVSIASSATSISNRAFYQSKLSTILISQNITQIGSSAFSYCRNLTTVVFEEGVTSIPSYAFQYANTLSTIILPSTLTSIGSNAFYECYSLQNINFPTSLKTISSQAFYGARLTSLTLPEGLISIGSHAFYNNRLTSITMQDNATSISDYAFADNTSLTSLRLSEKLNYIGYGAFYNTRLTSVTIPASVTTIESSAFSNISTLNEVHVKRISPITNIRNNVFDGANGALLIYVSALTIDTYKANTYWAYYEERITTNEFVITYITNGGSEVPSEAHVPGSTITAPESPLFAGCEFVGWFIDEELAHAFAFDVMPNEAVTLYAKWSTPIHFLHEGVSSTHVVQVGKEFDFISQQVLTKVGHIFLGWSLHDELVTETTVFDYAAGITLKSTFEISTFYILFETMGGDPLPPMGFAYQTDISGLTVVPTYPGYEFKGWYASPDYLTRYVFTTIQDSNITVYARWEAIKYVIEFEPNGGEELVTPDKQVTYDDLVGRLPIPVRTGYTFVGWNTAEDGSGIALEESQLYQIPTNASLFAMWQANSYKIYFNSSGGVSLNPKTVHYDQAIGSLGVTSRLFNRFVGWKHQNDFVTEDTIYRYTQDITLMAVWEPVPFDLTAVFMSFGIALVLLFILSIPARKREKKLRELIISRRQRLQKVNEPNKQDILQAETPSKPPKPTP